jgi:hypothetical protein
MKRPQGLRNARKGYETMDAVVALIWVSVAL